MKVTQSCQILCDPMDYTVHGILQARILEWVAFPFSRGSSQTRDQVLVSHIAGGFFTSWATREAHSSPKTKSVSEISVMKATYKIAKMRIWVIYWKKEWIVFKNMGFQVNRLGYKPWLCHFTAMWHWASYLLKSLCLNFISYEIQIITVVRW